MEDLTLDKLQREVMEWTNENFGGLKDRPKHHPLIGMMEELGELCHSHLKSEQNIRGTNEHHQENAKDAIGDILIFMVDYCNINGYRLQQIIEDVWSEVKERDWNKHREGSGLSCIDCGLDLVQKASFGAGSDRFRCSSCHDIAITSLQINK